MTMRWALSLLCLVTLATIVSAAPSPPPNPDIVYKEEGTVQKIVVMNSDGSNKTVVYSGQRFQTLNEPVFSPDAQWIALTSPGVGLLRVERVTGVATVLLTDAQCGSFCWNPRFSPSGARIAVIDGGLNTPRVLSVPTSGGATQVLYTGTPDTPIFDVAWSSDEARIAVVETVGAGLPDRILAVSLSGGTPRTLLEGPFDRINSIDWARAGVDRIVFDISVSPNSTDRNIYTIDFTDTGVSPPVLVTAGMHAGFSPDNTSIAYVRPTRNRTIAKLNLGTGVSTDLAAGVQPEWKR